MVISIMTSSDTCEIVASVTTDSLEVIGSSAVPHIYLCTSTGVYLPPAAPLVCGSAAAAYAVGKWAQTPAGKGLIEKAASLGCEVVVRTSNAATEILLVKGALVEKKTENFLHEAKRTHNAINSVEGVNWLMQVLSR